MEYAGLVQHNLPAIGSQHVTLSSIDVGPEDRAQLVGQAADWAGFFIVGEEFVENDNPSCWF
jgi:hypothetical protein